MTIYLDQVFCWNAAADFLLLTAIQRLLGLPVRRRRTCLMALVGGCYGVLTTLPGMGWLAHPFLILAEALLLAAGLFGRTGHLARYWLLLLVVSCGMAGAVVAVNRIGELPGRWPVFLASFLGCYGLLSWVFPGSAAGLRQEARLLRVQLRHKGCSTTFSCLFDTGNGLLDPLSGRPVLVVWRQALLPVLKAVETDEMRQLCYQSLGCPAGVLPYFLAEQVEIEGEVFHRQPVAVAPCPLSDGMGYAALWNGKGADYGNRKAKAKAV